MVGSFIRSRAAVARPTGVRATSNPSVVGNQPKWSDQVSARGV